MHYSLDYLFFLLKGVSIVALLLLGFAGIITLATKNKQKDKIKITSLHEKYHELQLKLAKKISTKTSFKKISKKIEKSEKEKDRQPRCFVIPFNGDIRASTVEQLSEAITMVLSLATPKDEIVLNLESPGGAVNGYGLCAAQLARIRTQGIPLTVVVDKVAASGGYLMASVGNKILAAPFALIGSIGVIAQLPNFHRFLKHHHVDFEQVTAGEFKRTLTVFGENTHKGREKMQEDLEDIHRYFKEYVQQYRPQLDLAKVATGEYWLGLHALDLNLIDGISTSEDYLLSLKDSHALFEIRHQKPRSFLDKILNGAENTLQNALLKLSQKNSEPPVF